MQATPAQLRGQKPRRRASHSVRGARPRGRRAPAPPRVRYTTWLILAGSLAILGFLAVGALARAFAPAGNTSAQHVDAIIVLGASVDRQGNPSPVLLSRIAEGVREYQRGVAPRLIVSGGEQHGHIQATIMARLAEAQGVPGSAVLQETQSTDTIENACFSEHIMKAHGWSSAEVVTSPSHLPRANVIFSRLPLQWRGHAAPLLSSAQTSWYDTSLEVLKTARNMTYARFTESCTP